MIVRACVPVVLPGIRTDAEHMGALAPPRGGNARLLYGPRVSGIPLGNHSCAGSPSTR